MWLCVIQISVPDPPSSSIHPSNLIVIPIQTLLSANLSSHSFFTRLRPALDEGSMDHKSRSDPEKHTLLLDRERELLDGRSDGGSSTSTLLDNMDSEGKHSELDDIEGAPPTAAAATAAPKVLIKSNRVLLTIWMVVNTVATIGIVSDKSTSDKYIGTEPLPGFLTSPFSTQVFVNKAIFNDPSFRQCQCAFAAFHFFVTGATLYVLSRPFFGLFVPKHLRVRTMLPLAIAMCLNIVLMNVSLAISTITFYQIARILLTPATVLLNFMFYHKIIPRKAAWSLIPMCIGVGIITYYEPKPGVGSKVENVGFLTVMVALISVFCSAVYTVWISAYQRKYDINGFQLLFNQAPVGGVVLLYVIPWTDKFPVFSVVPAHKWAMILLVSDSPVHSDLIEITANMITQSGFFASLINLSQFFIIIGAGPVSSTVVGHVKTCFVVGLGWLTSGNHVGGQSLFGVVVAIGSVF